MEFNKIHASVQAKYIEYETNMLSKENRKRKVGAGHPYKLQLKKAVSTSTPQ